MGNYVGMTPEQKIKALIVLKTREWQGAGEFPELTADNVDDVYDDLRESGEHWDGLYEVRSGEVETDIQSPFSRYYESKSVASQMPDGSWVGWTYWYGGGKHGEPESIDWIESAYDLEVAEEEKMVIVRTFKKCDE